MMYIYLITSTINKNDETYIENNVYKFDSKNFNKEESDISMERIKDKILNYDIVTTCSFEYLGYGDFE